LNGTIIETVFPCWPDEVWVVEVGPDDVWLDAVLLDAVGLDDVWPDEGVWEVWPQATIITAIRHPTT